MFSLKCHYFVSTWNEFTVLFWWNSECVMHSLLLSIVSEESILCQLPGLASFFSLVEIIFCFYCCCFIIFYHFYKEEREIQCIYNLKVCPHYCSSGNRFPTSLYNWFDHHTKKKKRERRNIFKICRRETTFSEVGIVIRKTTIHS